MSRALVCVPLREQHSWYTLHLITLTSDQSTQLDYKIYLTISVFLFFPYEDETKFASVTISSYYCSHLNKADLK